MKDFPYKNNQAVGIRFSVKVQASDFEVEEIPSYLPCGNGEHAYLKIEKWGMSTMDATRKIAKALALPDKAMGVAGLKDARAVTRQTVSAHIGNQPLPDRIDIEGIKILNLDRHSNKLRIGHLWGNRFSIKLRNFDAQEFPLLKNRLEQYAATGVPNYFGVQRFGRNADTWKIGKALVQKDFTSAREGAGKFNLRDKRKVSLYVNAFQAWMFNHYLARRIDTIARLIPGDLAYRHDSGAVFRVDDPSAEQQRADDFEISPSGPLFGYKMTRAGGQAGSLEQEILDEFEVTLEDFREKAARRAPGARRPLRFRPVDPEVRLGEDAAGSYCLLQFSLRAGCYATSLLRELGRDGMEYVDRPSVQNPPMDGQ